MKTTKLTTLPIYRFVKRNHSRHNDHHDDDGHDCDDSDNCSSFDVAAVFSNHQ